MVISYNNVGVATGNNFTKHSQNIIILIQSCRITDGSYKDEVILKMVD